MIVAAITTHSKGGFFLTSGGYEYNLVLAAAAISLAFSGAGIWSLDALAGFETGGGARGVAALAHRAGRRDPAARRRAACPRPPGGDDCLSTARGGDNGA